MPRNPSTGTYTLPEVAFTSGTVIQSSAVNSDLSDIATALTQSLATTGVSSMTGPIKAAAGTALAPSYTFAAALGTGFYLSGTNEISWTANGAQKGVFAASGLVTFQSLAVTGNQSIGGTLAVTSAASIGGSLVVTGAVGLSSTLTIAGAAVASAGLAIGGDSITVFATAGYAEFSEVAAPASPAADKARLYAVDESGTTDIVWKDSSGIVSGLRVATQAEMETGSSVLRTVSPGRQHFHPGHPKAGGNFDGTGTPAFRTGDYGMGAITDNGVGDYTLALDTAFSNTNYWINSWARSGQTDRRSALSANPSPTDVKTASTLQVRHDIFDGSPAPRDSAEVGITFWGDYA